MMEINSSAMEKKVWVLGYEHWTLRQLLPKACFNHPCHLREEKNGVSIRAMLTQFRFRAASG